MSTPILAIIDTNGFVHAAAEIEPAVGDGQIRLLGSWPAPGTVMRLGDVKRIVPLALGSAGDTFASVAEWAETRDLRMAP